jgi:hypothetical protein
VGEGQERPGIVVERHRAPRPSPTGFGDGIITVVRVDLRRYAFRFLSESHEGRRRPLPEWIDDHALTGGINAGMFLPGGRSVGFMMEDGEVRSDRQPRRFTGVLAFGPRGLEAPLGIGGAGCERDLGWFRAHYRSVLQSRKLLIDCEGHARPWPNRRRYSAAAIGGDEEGRAVLVHSRTPYRMEVLSRMLESMHLGIRGLAYMEGGPEASLVVTHPEARVREMGSYEDGFNPNDDNRAFWDLPNVIGFALRGGGE